MIVWRVGHKAALDSGFPSGPYTCTGMGEEDTSRVWGMAGEHSNSTHPSPYADPALKGIRSYERCGFDSREALNTWFDGWTDALDESGFEVWTYDVPDWAVRVGAHGQVVFDHNEAREIRRGRFEHEQLPLFA